MEVQDFDSKDISFGVRQWDRYGVFHRRHNSNYHFIMFESGEYMLDSNSVHVNDRKGYPDLGIVLGFPSELRGGKIYTASGEPVPNAQLEVNGQPTLLLDKKHNILVNAEMRHNWGLKMQSATAHRVFENLPNHLRNATVLWTNKDSRPLAHSTIQVSSPRKPDREERAYHAELRRLCTTFAKVANITKFDIHDAAVTPMALYAENKSANDTFKSLTATQRVMLATEYVIPRVVTEHDYLVWKPN